MKVVGSRQQYVLLYADTDVTSTLATIVVAAALAERKGCVRAHAKKTRPPSFHDSPTQMKTALRICSLLLFGSVVPTFLLFKQRWGNNSTLSTAHPTSLQHELKSLIKAIQFG